MVSLQVHTEFIDIQKRCVELHERCHGAIIHHVIRHDDNVTMVTIWLFCVHLIFHKSSKNSCCCYYSDVYDTHYTILLTSYCMG